MEAKTQVPEIPQDLIAILNRTDNITILTGSGVSAESGIPTFREAQTGLWSRYNPLELATPQAFQRNPKLVWDWYQWRRGLILSSKPNNAHFAIVKIESYIQKYSLITQNIDGLHKIAGSKNLLELHGNIHRTRCFNENKIVDAWEDTGEVPPRCPSCGGFLRPDVVWFGEMLSPDTQEKALHSAKYCEVFFSVGTSCLVEPAASLPLIAVESGATLIEVNINETPISKFADYGFRVPAGVVLPKFAEIIWKVKN
jgi:NAD-dependent deacetylase